MDVGAVEIVCDRHEGAKPIESDARLELTVERIRQLRQVGHVYVRSSSLQGEQKLLLAFGAGEITAHIAVTRPDVLERLDAVHVRRPREHRDAVVPVWVLRAGQGPRVVVGRERTWSRRPTPGAGR